MLDGSVPITRFSATDWLLGWTKATPSPAPMLKLCQLMAAFWLDWLMVRAPGPEPMLAAPAVTWPPVGRAWAPEAQARASSPTEAASLCRRLRPASGAGEAMERAWEKMFMTVFPIF
jgi:hypothetical protein